MILGNAFDLLPQVAPKSVRLLLTDPPYLVSRKNNLQTMGRTGIDFDFDRASMVFPDHVSWLKLAAPAVVPSGSVVIFNDWKVLGTIAEELTRLGFEVKRMLVWRKNNPRPTNIGRSFVQASEYALWAVKRGTYKGKKWVFNKRPEVSYERGEFDYPIPSPGQRRGHPTKKPDGLFRDLVGLLSNPGETVLDPFGGVGTTEKVCQALGRKCISFEIDPRFCRVDEVVNGDPVES